MKKFDASIPRAYYWKHEIENHNKCPECSTHLEIEQHTYYIAINDKGDISALTIGSDAGSFCSKCPIVVLDEDIIIKMIKFGGVVDNSKFIVFGIVDMNAVPEDKRSIPFGDDNPIPIVRFTNLNLKKREPKKKDSRTSNKKKRLRKSQKKRKRS